jgi:hypothetical protein
MNYEDEDIEKVLDGRLEEDQDIDEIVETFQNSREKEESQEPEEKKGEEIERLRQQLEEDESHERVYNFYSAMEIRPWKRKILQDAVSETDYQDITEFMHELLETNDLEEREEYIDRFEEELERAIRERELDISEQPEGLERLKSDIENGYDEDLFYRIFEGGDIPEYIRN